MTPEQMTPGGTYRLEFVGGLGDTAGTARELRGRFIGHATSGPPALRMAVDGEPGIYAVERDRLRYVQSVDPVAAGFGPRPLMPDRARGDWP